MRIARVLGVIILSAMLCACACSKKGGASKPGDADDSTVPVAEVGSQLKDISFAFDSSALSEAAKNTLRDNARWLMDNSGYAVTVEGHCDERGTNEYNMALGERRAKSAQDFLKGLGVAAGSMSTISYGEEMPLDAGHNEAAWEKNRRAHFRVGK